MTSAWVRLCGFLLACAAANESMAGSVLLPADVAVTLTATPSSNLNAGQRITMVISVTNNGPDPVDRVVLLSSAIYNELDTTTASADCAGNLVLAVVDLGSSFYYMYTWSAATAATPIAPGESRGCTLNIDYTAMAPPIFPVTFGFPNWLSDQNPSNNTATATLLGAAASPAAPVPTLSAWGAALLATTIALAARALFSLVGSDRAHRSG
ncbi:hypothetical protein [Dokdonella sp.]|uniref:hypothetical protein n=1 Tax=Dokdonella sp. TaxID=2291710 RepID=UPI002F427D97